MWFEAAGENDATNDGKESGVRFEGLATVAEECAKDSSEERGGRANSLVEGHGNGAQAGVTESDGKGENGGERRDFEELPT